MIIFLLSKEKTGMIFKLIWCLIRWFCVNAPISLRKVCSQLQSAVIFICLYFMVSRSSRKRKWKCLEIFPMLHMEISHWNTSLDIHSNTKSIHIREKRSGVFGDLFLEMKDFPFFFSSPFLANLSSS